MDGLVKLERRALGGFGFSVIGGVDTHLPPMICAVVQHGSAHLSGRITAGDVILEVNGQSITELSTQEVVECIRDSPDELTLRLMKDTGAKERAKPYLRPFTVADPKIPLYQAKLHRTASAPLKPHRRPTDLSGVKPHQKSGEIMRRNTTVSKGELRVVGQKNLLGMDESPDGRYSPKRDFNDPYRIMTYFPVDGKPPQTVENLKVSNRTEKPERRSFPEEVSDGSSTTLSIGASANSLPKSCPSCGGGMLVSSTPGLHGASTKQGIIPTALQCRKCGKNIRVTVSNTSLPEKSRTSKQTYESSHLKPSNSLPPNVSLSTQPLRKDNDTKTHNSRHDNDLKSGSASHSSSSGTITGSDVHIEKDRARELALKLYRLLGYTKDEVAPELSKNTDFSKMVAREYLKLFDFSSMSIVVALREFIKHVLLIGETQERERILIPFSERYYDCNRPEYGSSDAIHTLVCAILLLNTDLHAEKISKKMTMPNFYENMTGLCDDGDFPRELLKTIYQEIKQTAFEWSGEKPPGSVPGTPKPSRSMNGIRGIPGNPFLEIQCDENDKVYREGLLYRKVTMSDGKKTSAWKRKWLPFYATLKGLILFLHKSDEVSALENNRNCLGIHHSFASRATDYRKRHFVFRLVTADWREFLFQAKDLPDMKEWIDTINLVAATFSSPPLAAPVGSSKRFQRPVLPFSKTRLTLVKQIEHHEKKAKEAQDELIACLQSEPRDGTSREQQEWQEKRDFLEYEYKRYMSYVTALRGSKLESKLRDKPKGDGRSADQSIMLQLKRSSSIGNLDFSQGYRPRNIRESYFMAIYQGQ